MVAFRKEICPLTEIFSRVSETQANRVSSSISVMESDSKVPAKGAPGSRQNLKGKGIVQFGADWKPCKIWTRYGFSAPNPWLNFPLPNVTYFVGANSAQRAQNIRLCHIFQTTYDGSTEQATDLSVRVYDDGAGAGERWPKELCVPVGFPGGSFDRGHLIAAQFGAGMERINLVTMPNSVNQAHKPVTAARFGHITNAILGEKYRSTSPGRVLKGTMSYSGEFILPNYREFETIVVYLAKRGLSKGFEVSLKIEPTTVQTKTDVVHAKFFLGDKTFGFEIACDLS